MEQRTDPTLPEIAAACIAIQAGWTETTRQARIADDRVRNELTGHYTVPVIPAAYLTEAIDHD